MLTRRVLEGISAGILISIGGCVYLSCANKYVGAVLFSVALLMICWKGYSLFTGKVGFIVENHTKNDFSVLLLGLLGNTIGVCALGFAVSYAIPALGEAALASCTAKLEQQFFQTLIRAMLCGVLMYLAVSTYKEEKGIAGILFCIPVFILSGFEHSIADMFYFAASGMVSLKAFGFIWTVILGNAIGAAVLPILRLGKGK